MEGEEEGKVVRLMVRRVNCWNERDGRGGGEGGGAQLLCQNTICARGLLGMFKSFQRNLPRTSCNSFECAKMLTSC